MLQITFNRDGRISVFAIEDGITISVTAPINQLQAVLPPATFTAVRERMVAFIEQTPQAPRLQVVR